MFVGINVDHSYSAEIEKMLTDKLATLELFSRRIEKAD